MSESAVQLLASCLNGSRDWLKAATSRGLRYDDFQVAAHQEIWRVIEKLSDAGRGVRLGTVETELRKNPDAAAEAKQLANRGPSFQSPEFHVEQILVNRLRMDAMAVFSDASGSLVGLEKVSDFQARIRDVATRLDGLASSTHDAARDNRFIPVISRTVDEMERQLSAHRNGKAPWVTTGIPDLDRAIGGGWQKPGSYVVVGMSGRGKTHIGIHFALEAARAGSAVVYFTVEMPQSQIMRRIMANAGAIRNSSLAAVDLTEDEEYRLQSIPITHGHLKLAIEDDFNASLERVTDLIRKYRRLGLLDIAVIDYVQQLVPPKKGHSKQQDMLVVAHELKQVCIHEGIVMIILAQANREAEVAEQAGQRLNATHIEHSHAIYQNADMVAFFQTMERKEKSITGNIIEVKREEMLYIAKNRHGDGGKIIPVSLDYEHSRLRPYART